MTRPDAARLAPAILGGYAFVGGLSTFIGWSGDIQRLTDWVNSGISMMPNMAVALMFAGAAMVLQFFGHRRLAAVLGVFTALIGAATLFQHLTGANLGIDRLLVSQPWGQRGTLAPGRIGPPGSTSLTIIGTALLLATLGRKSRKAAVGGGMVVFCVALLSITGYVFGADSFYSLPRLTVIAFQTATFLLALAIGLVMSVPEAQPMKTLLADTTAGLLARRALPFIILLPLVLGLLRLRGQEAGLYDTAFGTSLRTLVEILLLVALLWWALAKVAASETALRRERERVTTVLNSITTGYQIIDRNGRFAEFNEAAQKMFASQGVNAGALIGKHIFEEAFPDARDLPSGQAIRRALAERVPTEAESFYDPWQRWFAVHNYPTRDGGVATFFEDITVRKQTEENLRRSEERFRTLVAQVKDYAIFSVDLSGRATTWNEGVQRVLGFEETEFIGQDIVTAIFTPEDAASGVADRELQLAAAEGTASNDRWMQKKDATRFYATGVTTALKDASGTVIGFTKVMRDSTREKQSEDALRESRNRIEAELADTRRLQEISALLIQERDGDAIYQDILDATIAVMRSDFGSMQMFNDDLNEMRLLVNRGFTPEAAAFWERVRSSSGSTCASALKTGQRTIAANIETCEFMAGTNDLETYRKMGIKAVQSTPLISRSGQLLGMISTHWREPHQSTERELGLLDMLARQAADLIERKQAGEALRQAHELLGSRAKQLEKLVEKRTADLQETVQQLETFSYSIVHDMRAPLRAMRSFASVLEAEYRDKLDDEGRDYLQRIMSSSSRMDALITDVLSYSRVAMTQAELGPVNLDKLVREIVEQYPQFQEAASAIHIQRPLPVVVGNTALLTQVFSNLLGNALKFMPPDRSPRVVLRAEESGEHVRVWVEDNGIGIPVEHREKIFGLFQRLHQPDKYSGTGVGLAIVKKAVERMGGTVGFESDARQGSRFWFKIAKEAGSATALVASFATSREKVQT